MEMLYFLFLFFFSVFVCPSFSALLAPISIDPSTSQYTISVYLKTPLQPTKLLIDLRASFSWIDCTHTYNSTASSTFHHVPCNSSLCGSLQHYSHYFNSPGSSCSSCLGFPSPGCANKSCALSFDSVASRKGIVAQALVDSLALPTTDGRSPGPLYVLPEFVLSCSRAGLLRGRATGLAGLGRRSNFSLPAQVSSALSSPRAFAICLSGSPSAPGVAFFGSRGPYFFHHEIDLSKTLIYTPLLENPVGTSKRTYDDYFIGVSAIKVNGKAVNFDHSLLTVDKNGFGATTISTVAPYTVLHTSIYNAFTDAFVNESAALNLIITTAMKPFGVCYPAQEALSTRVGPAFPTVDLVMGSDDVFWRIFGSNSMVRIAENGVEAWCLGFVDGGANREGAAVVIGAHQMQDNLLQFDVGLMRLGFSSSVLVHNTTCANFNFTTNINLK